MTGKVFLNDKILDSEAACIGCSDSGFLYGAGLFETMRSCSGTVWRLEDHLDRLLASSAALSINLTYDRDYIKTAIYKTLQANELADARIRLTVSGGPLEQEQPQSTLLITAARAQDYPKEYYENGVFTVLCDSRQNPSDPLTGHKVTSYFSRMLALQQARSKRASEALWFTLDNRLAEGCISNVFIVKDSKLLTPKDDTPVLPGIARKAVLELADENGISAEQTDISIDDVLAAEEIFLTNVVMKAMAVNCLEQHPVNEGKVGPVTRKVQELLENDIKQRCEG